MKKKGMFTGFFTIFSFTAKQSMKGKGFKTAGILIGLFVFLLFFAVPVIMANVQKSDSETDDYGMEEKPLEDYEPEEIPDAFLVLDTGTFDTSLFEEFTKLWGEGVFAVEYSDMQITDENYGRLFEEYKETYKRPVALKAERKKGELVFSYYVFRDADDVEAFTDHFAELFAAYYDNRKYQTVPVSEEIAKLVQLPVVYEVVEAGGKEEDFNTTIARMIIPAVFSLLLFMMTIIYGQSITKVVMSEKSSKLMEMLLTSVQPYALLAGKIVAMACVAIAQMAAWILLGIAGFTLGCQVAEQVYADYTNYITEFIEIVQKGSSGFSVAAVVLSILMMLTGFLLYCVWAGFIASAVDNVEDVSTAMSLYQIPVLAGFMISYLGSMMELDTVTKIAEYVPISSPFVMPADILDGKVTITGGAISFVLLVIFTVGLIYVTGRIYKGKIFNKK